jgi:hypothetical protein
VSTARRAVLVLALVGAMAMAMMVLSGVASAEPPDHANASCFGKSESVDKEAPGPGTEISLVAKSTARTGTTPVAAKLVPPLQESTHTACQDQKP